MAGKNTAAFGLFSSVDRAERGVDALLAAGFRSDDVSVLAPDQKTTKEFATEKNTKAPEGTTTGAAAGGAVGGHTRIARGHRCTRNPGARAFHRCWAHYGSFGRLGCRCGHRWSDWCLGRNGDARI